MSWLELNSFSFRWLKCQVHCYSLFFHELSHLYMSVLVMALFVTSWRFWFVKGCNQPFMVCHGWNWNRFHLDDFSIMWTLILDNLLVFCGMFLSHLLSFLHDIADKEILLLHTKVDLVVTLGGDGTVLWVCSVLLKLAANFTFKMKEFLRTL